MAGCADTLFQLLRSSLQSDLRLNSARLSPSHISPSTGWVSVGWLSRCSLGRGAAPAPCSGPGLGLLQAGREARWGSSVRDLGPGLQGAHSAAGSRTQTVTVRSQRAPAWAGRGSRAPAQPRCWRKRGWGSGSGTGSRWGNWEAGLLHPGGLPQSPLWSAGVPEPLQVWISPSAPCSAVW